MRAKTLQATDFKQLSPQDATSSARIHGWLAPTGGDLAKALTQAAHDLSRQQGAHLSWDTARVHHTSTLEALAPGPAFALRAWHHDTELLLSLDLHLAQAWLELHFAPLAQGPRSARPLNSLEEGLLTSLLARLCASVAAQGGPALYLDTLPARQDLTAQRLCDVGQGLLCVTSTLKVGDKAGRLRILAPARQASAKLRAIPHREDALRRWCQAPPQQSLHATLHVELARLHLPHSTLQQWEPQAVLLVADLSKHARLYFGAKPAWSLCLEGAPSQQHHFRLHPLTQDPPMTQDDAASLADLPVQVSVRLPDLTLPLAQIAALEAGQVLAMEQPLHGPVTLSAGGRELAQAELVSLEGKLGLRILTVHTPSQRDS